MKTCLRCGVSHNFQYQLCYDCDVLVEARHGDQAQRLKSEFVKFADKKERVIKKLREQRNRETERYQLSQGMSHEQTFHFIKMDGRNYDAEIEAIERGDEEVIFSDVMKAISDDPRCKVVVDPTKCPPHRWDRSGERCEICGTKDWMT